MTGNVRRDVRLARARFYGLPWGACLVGVGFVWLAPETYWQVRAITITVLFIAIAVEETQVRNAYYRRGWTDGLLMSEVDASPPPPVWLVDGALRRARRKFRQAKATTERTTSGH